jgi:multiple antibiotic resistance protein
MPEASEINQYVDANRLLDLSAVFTLLFVTLGPIKILGPFAVRTREIGAPQARKLAFLSFIMATAAAIVGGFMGVALLEKWRMSLPALLLAGGIVFFLVALKMIMEQYNPARETAPPLPPSPMAAALQLTFPAVLTPYGVAALIIMLANSPNAARTQAVLGILLVVMLLNLVAMLFARWIVSGFGAVVLQVLGAVLGVLQLTLAVEMIFRGMNAMGFHG